METSDPDDFITLCFLLSHPQVRLRAVIITPGHNLQVGLVRKVLKITNYDNIPIGVRTLHYHKAGCLSEFHYKVFDIEESEPDGEGWQIIFDVITKYPDLTIVTGSPVTPIKDFIKRFPTITIKRWVGQGGFAGDNIVPEEHRLEKFKGLTKVATYNFNGDPKAAKVLLNSENIEKRILVSKNVAHGIVYDAEVHKKYEAVKDKYPGTQLIYKTMDIYLNRTPDIQGKKFHDPLAACVSINEDICKYKEVELVTGKGKWGSQLKDGSNTYISISVDEDLFWDVFFCR
jgi:pyrimidine-specific ribonucleoside hydrolase